MELQLNPLYTQSEEWEHLDRLLICTKSGKRYRFVKERKGKWNVDEDGNSHCPFCGSVGFDNFCSNCGTDMRGEE